MHLDIEGNRVTQVWFSEETDRFATYNGQPAIRLEVSRVGDQTPITVSDAVKRKVRAL